MEKKLTDIRNLSRLLNMVSSDQEKISSVFVHHVKKTYEYRKLQELSASYYLSDKAKELREKFNVFTFNRTDLEELIKEFDHLCELAAELKKMEKESTKKLLNKEYHVDIVTPNGMEKLEKQHPDFAKLMKIYLDSGSTVPGEALRTYLKKNKDQEATAEYLKLRTREQQEIDRERHQNFYYWGAIFGALLFLAANYSIHFPYQFEIIAGLGLLLFTAGLFPKSPSSLKGYSAIYLCFYLILCLALSLRPFIGVLQGLSPQEIVMEVNSVLLGGYAGFSLLKYFNRLPHFPFRVSSRLKPFIHIYHRRVPLVLIFGLFGAIWFHSYQSDESVLQTLRSAIGKQTLAYEEKIAAESAAAEALKQAAAPGKLQVTELKANTRNSPALNGKIVDTVNKDAILLYYGAKKDKDGRTWYEITIGESKKKSWISEKTVKVIEEKR
ncbi:hypothetical protein [Mesobacillus jeotgali]|uniref:hypothetical protein n=1 Tax=Mesobacillus jeotgali TaxID=129985 RepID=UPI001CFE662F|nr:hypothetical protein [Mesobacillus jeotgali]